MTPHGDWNVAEHRVSELLTRQGKTPTRMVAHPQLPYLFEVYHAGGMTYALVDGDQIRQMGVDPQGTEGLGSYLRNIDLLHRKDVSVDDLLALLSLFDAYPPVKEYSTPQGFFLNKEATPDYVPRLEMDPAGARLLLFYLVRRPGGNSRRGDTLGPAQQQAAKWTLTIPPDYRLSWNEELFTYSTP